MFPFSFQSQHDCPNKEKQFPLQWLINCLPTYIDNTFTMNNSSKKLLRNIKDKHLSYENECSRNYAFPVLRNSRNVIASLQSDETV